MHPKGADGLANSVDPDQAAPLGAVTDLGLHCLPRPICPKTLDHYGKLQKAATHITIYRQLPLCQPPISTIIFVEVIFHSQHFFYIYLCISILSISKTVNMRQQVS